MKAVSVHLLLAVVAIVAALGCQRPATLPPSASPAVMSADNLRALGDERRVGGDHAGALKAYQDALRMEGEEVGLRYLVAAMLANLDRRADAIEAFGRVIAIGPADREEVRIARQWLTEAGALGEARREPGVTEAAEIHVGGAVLSGRTEWKDPDAAGVAMLKILLDGNDAATSGRRYFTRVRLNEPYRIEGIQPGRYRVVAGVGMTKLWQLDVTVGPTGATTLDLTPASSSAAADALRPRAS